MVYLFSFDMGKATLLILTTVILGTVAAQSKNGEICFNVKDQQKKKTVKNVCLYLFYRYF